MFCQRPPRTFLGASSISSSILLDPQHETTPRSTALLPETRTSSIVAQATPLCLPHDPIRVAAAAVGRNPEEIGREGRPGRWRRFAPEDRNRRPQTTATTASPRCPASCRIPRSIIAGNPQAKRSAEAVSATAKTTIHIHATRATVGCFEPSCNARYSYTVLMALTCQCVRIFGGTGAISGCADSIRSLLLLVLGLGLGLEDSLYQYQWPCM